MSNEKGQLIELRLINSDKVTINLDGRYQEVTKNGTLHVPAELAESLLTEGHLDGGGNLINRWWPADQPVPDFEKGGHNPVLALQAQQAKYEAQLSDQAAAIAQRDRENAELRAKLAALESAAVAPVATAPAAEAPAAEAPVVAAPADAGTDTPAANAGAVVADAGARSRTGAGNKNG